MHKQFDRLACIVVVLTALFLPATAVGQNLGSKAENKPYNQISRECTPSLAGSSFTLNCARQGPDAQVDKHKAERDQRDLIAQESMADSTRKILNWTFAQIGISALGLLGLAWTLYETRRTAKAAIESNEIAREIGAAQVRAYLSLESAVLVITDTLPFWQVSVKNSGQSPASIARLAVVPEISFMDMSKLPEKQPLTALDFKNHEIQIGSLAPGEKTEDFKVGFILGDTPLPEASLGSIMLNEQTNCFVSATFFLVWLDIFGDECDVTGTILVKKFETVNAENRLKEWHLGFGKADVRTSVYDSTSWFRRRNTKHLSGKKQVFK